jgi:hypothetical protein
VAAIWPQSFVSITTAHLMHSSLAGLFLPHLAIALSTYVRIEYPITTNLSYIQHAWGLKIESNIFIM